MKKLAARNFENLLQCSIPTFEDLLNGPHNKRLMKLLYRTAEWHMLAKLRMHTDSTLEHLEMLTKEFGFLMQQFRDLTCLKFRTAELPCEVASQNRQQERPQTRVPSKSASSTRTVTLNLFNNKIPFAWRLCVDNTNVQMYRFLLNPTCMTFSTVFPD